MYEIIKYAKTPWTQSSDTNTELLKLNKRSTANSIIAPISFPRVKLPPLPRSRNNLYRWSKKYKRNRFFNNIRSSSVTEFDFLHSPWRRYTYMAVQHTVQLHKKFTLSAQIVVYLPSTLLIFQILTKDLINEAQKQVLKTWLNHCDLITNNN